MARLQDLDPALLVQIFESWYQHNSRRRSYYDVCSWLQTVFCTCRVLLPVGRQFLYQDIHISTVESLVLICRTFSDNPSLAMICSKLALRLPEHSLPSFGDESEVHGLSASTLVNLLSAATRIQHLTISDQKWGAIEKALQSAGFSNHLKFLSLKDIAISSTDLPLRSLLMSDRFPYLEELQLVERQQIDSSKESESTDKMTQSQLAIQLSFRDRQADIWVELESLTIKRIDWSLDNARLDLPMLGGYLYRLSLTMPADCIIAIPDNFATVLPDVVRFAFEPLGIEKLDDYLWCQSLCITLQATTSLVWLTLTASYLPSTVCDYLPASLCHLILNKCMMEAEHALHEGSLTLRNLCKCVSAGKMQHLKSLTYEPTTTIVSDLTEGGWGNASILPVVQKYLVLFDTLRMQSGWRSIGFRSRVCEEIGRARRLVQEDLDWRLKSDSEPDSESDHDYDSEQSETSRSELARLF